MLINPERTGREDRTIQRIRLIRTNDVKDIANVIEQTDVANLRQTIRYYPLRFLGDGINAYRYAFDNASIFYAGEAVELALLALLIDEIKFKRCQNPKLKKIDLNWLIKNAGGILDDENMELANDVRKMRNCYIHYENIIAHLGWMDEVALPQILEMMRNDPFNNTKSAKLIDLISKLMQEYPKSVGMLPIRFEHLETNPEIIPFIENQIEQYLSWLPFAWESRKRELSAEEFTNIYGIETYEALQCINWSFKIVHKLGLI